MKDALLGQFGKSKWQSYFELLRLPIEMQGLKPSVIMGKLKQHLLPGVSPDTDLFSCNVSYSPTAFHARSGRSWKPQDSCSHGKGCGCPVGCSRRPRPHSRSRLDSAQLEPCSYITTGSEATKRAVTPALKVTPLPALIFISFKTVAMASVNFTTIEPTRLTGVLHLVLGQKTRGIPECKTPPGSGGAPPTPRPKC